MRYAIPRCAGKGMTLRVRSDSSCFIFQAMKMSSADPAVQPILREIMWLAAVYGVRLEFEHLSASSKEIAFVDALSRRTQADAAKRAKYMAAGKALAVLDNLERILAIELLAAAQAYDLQPPALARAPRTDALYRRIRARVAPYADDRPLNGDFAALHTILRTTRP